MSGHDRPAGSPVTIETPDGLALAGAHHPAEGGDRGTVLLVHGITRDMDEGGMFVRLAARLTGAGFDVVRFTFRGHGDSDGTARGVTVAGERLDVESAFEHARERFEGPYFVVAKSFGAVSTCLSLDRLGDDLSGLALWSPVLDVEGTFLDPHLPWGQRNFTGESLRELEATGSLAIDGEFEVGHVLWDELHRYDPADPFVASDLPALVVHGDADGIVPYEDARRVAAEKGAAFHTIDGGDHGFVRPDEGPVSPTDDREHDRVTVEWLVDLIDGGA